MNNLIIRHIFNDAVKQHRYVRRDETGVEYIALRGKKALGNGGLDHIYLITSDKLGLWITSGTINATIRRLQSKVSNLKGEQLGDGEAVLSAPLDQLENLCKAAGARVRPRYSEEVLSNKRKAIKHARAYLPSDREAS